MKRCRSLAAGLRRDTLLALAVTTVIAASLFFRFDPLLPDWAGERWLPLILHTALVLAALLLIRERVCGYWDAVGDR